MRKGLSEDSKLIKDILDKADVLWLALVDSEGPYSVPVNFGEVDGTLYIHSGKRGRKAAALDGGAPVAFSAAVDVRMRQGGDNACDQGYLFRSVMGNGTPRLVEGEEKMIGLDAISVKYLGKNMPYVEKVLAVTNVYAIDVEATTARVKE